MATAGADPKQPKERKKCPYGFDCSGMMMMPGTIAEHCENVEECVDLAKAEGVPWDALEQPTFDLVVYRQEREEERERRRIEWEAGREERERRQQEWEEEYRRIREVFRVRQHEAAVLMLTRRGNPQNYEDFLLEEQIEPIREALGRLAPLLPNLDRGYIAPDEVGVHVYSVKRPPTNKFPEGWSLRQIRQHQNVYYYHKLLSVSPQFTCILEDEEGNPKPCKVIHLSKSDDARNIQGRLGIERRNRLSKIRTRLLQARKALEEAAAIAAEDPSYEDLLLLSEEAAQQSENLDENG